MSNTKTFDCSQNLQHVYYMTGMLLDNLSELSHGILTRTHRHYVHFVAEETETWRGNVPETRPHSE